MPHKAKFYLSIVLLTLVGFCEPLFAQQIPLPPRRPPDLQPPVTEPLSSPAAVTPNDSTPISPETEPVLTDLSPEELLTLVNSALSRQKQFSAKFSQTDQSGSVLTGRLMVLRPGRLRFDYNPPSALKIIADGSNVAVIDQRLGTQDNYSIGLTPLKFLLSRTIDLGKEFDVISVDLEKDLIVVDAEDRATFGGKSQIRLSFDQKTKLLRQWTITDPQGYLVTVSLSQIDTKHEPDVMQFVIPNR